MCIFYYFSFLKYIYVCMNIFNIFAPYVHRYWIGFFIYYTYFDSSLHYPKVDWWRMAQALSRPCVQIVYTSVININKLSFFSFLNENSDLVFNELKDSYEKALSSVFQDITNKIFDKVPMNKIFLDG